MKDRVLFIIGCADGMPKQRKARQNGFDVMPLEISPSLAQTEKKKARKPRRRVRC